jgi:hypothetical protein
MKQVEWLLPAQEEKIQDISDRWIRLGASTEPVSAHRARILAGRWNRTFFKDQPRRVLYLHSPLACWLAVAALGGSGKRDHPGDAAGVIADRNWREAQQQRMAALASDRVMESVLRAAQAVQSRINRQIEVPISNWKMMPTSNVLQVVDSVFQTLYPVWKHVRRRVGAPAWDPDKPAPDWPLGDRPNWWADWPFFYGHFWAPQFAQAEAMHLIGVNAIKPIEFIVMRDCSVLGGFFPIKDFLIVGSRPSALHLTPEGLLHNEQGPAVEYADGYHLFFLNGVAMESKHVLTPAEKLRPESVLAETNVDRRRELLRKVGVERMLEKLPHRVLDKVGNYELLSVRLSWEIPDARYLRMLNPSIGVWHVEGVDPSCRTVKESLKWRNSNWFADAEALS